jgi:hypothetical protein
MKKAEERYGLKKRIGNSGRESERKRETAGKFPVNPLIDENNA